MEGRVNNSPEALRAHSQNAHETAPPSRQEGSEDQNPQHAETAGSAQDDEGPAPQGDTKALTRS